MRSFFLVPQCMEMEKMLLVCVFLEFMVGVLAIHLLSVMEVKKKKKPCCCVVIKVLNATKESTSSSTSVPQLIYEKNDIRL